MPGSDHTKKSKVTGFLEFYTVYLPWIKSASVFPIPVQTSSMRQQRQDEGAPTFQFASQSGEGRSPTNLTIFIPVHAHQTIHKPHSVCLTEGLLL